MSVVRLLKEYTLSQTDHLDGISISLYEELNLYHWQVSMLGPKESPYVGGLFLLDVHIPFDYPLAAPIIKFITKIYHPNVGSDGTIYLDFLQSSKWTPFIRISKTFELIIQSLKTPSTLAVKAPSEAALVYEEDKNKYEAIAREWTRKYAM